MLLVALAIGSQAATAEPAARTIDLAGLLSELADRSAVARRPEPIYRIRSSSSQNVLARSTDSPTGGSQPTAPRLTEVDGTPEAVLADIDGPGALVRLESPNPAGRLRIHVDGAELAVLDSDLGALLAGKDAVPAPLASAHASGGALYLPIPFAKSCRVVVRDPGPLAYDLEWRDYGSETRITSFRVSDLERLGRDLTHTIRLWSASAPAGGEDTFTFHLSRAAPSGELLGNGGAPTRGPRAVTEIRLRVDAPHPAEAIRDAVLRLGFDGVETVVVPLAAFFTIGDELRPRAGRFVVVDSSGDLIARWVMPYRERFTMRIENRGDPELHIAGSIRTTPWEWDDRTRVFHASWVPPAPALHPNAGSLTFGGPGTLVGLATLSSGTSPSRCALVDIAAGVGRMQPIQVEHACLPAHIDGVCARLDSFTDLLCGRSTTFGTGYMGFVSQHRFRALDAIPFQRDASLILVNQPAHDAPDVERGFLICFYRPDAYSFRFEHHPEDPPGTLPVLRYLPGLDTVVVVGSSSTLELERSVDRGRAALEVRAQSDGDHVELELATPPGRRSVAVDIDRSDAELRYSIDGSPIASRSGPNQRGGSRVALGVHDIGAKVRLRIEVVGTRGTGPTARHFALERILVR